MSRKNMQKPYVVRFKLDRYILVIAYICFFCKIPLDLMFALYEMFGKHALFVFKALSCKGFIRVSDSQLSEIISKCTTLESQIKEGYIRNTIFDSGKKTLSTYFDDKMLRFINYFVDNTENIYANEIRFFFDLEDFYGA